MKLVLLGSAGYHPSNHRQTACLMIPELGIILDAGTAIYRIREQLCTSHLDIFLTHAHLDHVVGLTFLLDVLHEQGVDRVTVHGAADKLAAIRDHLFAPELFPVAPSFEFAPLDSFVSLPEGGVLTTFPLVHPGGSLGFRLQWPGHSLAYVTDTTAAVTADYVKQIQGVDLLLHECNFPDGQESFAELTGHSCLTPVVEVARAANVRRLVLVHIDPLADQIRPLELGSFANGSPTVVIGQDGMEWEF